MYIVIDTNASEHIETISTQGFIPVVLTQILNEIGGTSIKREKKTILDIPNAEEYEERVSKGIKKRGQTVESLMNLGGRYVQGLDLKDLWDSQVKKITPVTLVNAFNHICHELFELRQLLKQKKGSHTQDKGVIASVANPKARHDLLHSAIKEVIEWIQDISHCQISMPKNQQDLQIVMQRISENYTVFVGKFFNFDYSRDQEGALSASQPYIRINGRIVHKKLDPNDMLLVVTAYYLEAPLITNNMSMMDQICSAFGSYYFGRSVLYVDTDINNLSDVGRVVDRYHASGIYRLNKFKTAKLSSSVLRRSYDKDDYRGTKFARVKEEMSPQLSSKTNATTPEVLHALKKCSITDDGKPQPLSTSIFAREADIKCGSPIDYQNQEKGNGLENESADIEKENAHRPGP